MTVVTPWIIWAVLNLFFCHLFSYVIRVIGVLLALSNFLVTLVFGVHTIRKRFLINNVKC